MFTQDASPTDIKESRMRAILKQILNHKRITRNHLCSILHLSLSSVAKYVKALIDSGFVRETDQGVATGGRKSIYLELNPAVGTNITIVLNKTYLDGALIDVLGREVARYSMKLFQGIPKDDLLEKLYACIDELMNKSREDGRKIFGIGIALGGYIDPENGISHEYLFSRGWYDVPLSRMITERYQRPCFLVNDANAIALTEKYYGMGIGVSNFLTVMLGEGIGMGIFVNGEIYMGSTYYSGEFGHTQTAEDGQLCYCGHTGCLETVSSKQYIMRYAREGLSKGVHSDVLKYSGSDLEQLELRQLIDAANNGDRFTRNLFNQIGGILGAKLSDVANIFNPELIILRGEVIDGNRVLFEAIEREVKNLTLRPIAQALKVLYSEKFEDSRFKGIGSYILLNYFL